MIRRIACYTDFHDFAVHGFGFDGNILSPSTPNDYYLGDNVDLVHCCEDEISTAMKAIRIIEKNWVRRGVAGNHELNKINMPDFLVVGDTLLTHGDWLFWKPEHVVAYRAGTPAKSRLSHSGVVDFLRHLPQPVFNPSILERIKRYADMYGCKMVVCGHRHPRQLVETNYKGIQIAVLPRGRTEVEILT